MISASDFTCSANFVCFSGGVLTLNLVPVGLVHISVQDWVYVIDSGGTPIGMYLDLDYDETVDGCYHVAIA
jgi:hypothetical protein